MYNFYLFKHRKSKELNTEEELKKEKKKKIIAELFGSKEEPIKVEETSISNTAALNKSDWLELKTEEPSVSLLNGRQTIETNTSKTEIKVNQDDDVNEKAVHFSNSSRVSDRRKSEGKPHELQKNKHRFKSLDMDLLHFDSINSSEHEKNLQTNSETEFYKKVNDDEDVPNDIKSFPDNIGELILINFYNISKNYAISEIKCIILLKMKRVACILRHPVRADELEFPNQEIFSQNRMTGFHCKYPTVYFCFTII